METKTVKYFNRKLEAMAPEDHARIVDALYEKLGVSHTTPEEKRRNELYKWLERCAVLGETTELEFIDSLFSYPLEEILRVISGENGV